MTDWFADSYASDASRTKGEMKTVFETIQSVGQETLGGAAESSAKTLSSDAFTPDADLMTYPLAPQTGTTDNLQTINTTNTRNGHFILIRNNDAANTITVKHGTGNIYLSGGVDLALNNTSQYVGLIRRGSNWYEIFRGSWLMVQQLVGGKEETEITIASGVAPVTQAQHRLEGEGGASDNLDGAASTGWIGNILILRCTNASHVITVRHNQSPGSGYKFITRDGNSIVLNDTDKYVVFSRDTANTCWREVLRGGFVETLAFGGTGADLSGASQGSAFFKNGSGVLEALSPVASKYLKFNSAANALEAADGAAIGTNYFGDGSDGATTISADTTVGDATPDNDFVIKQYTTLTVDVTRNLTTQARKRAFLVYTTGACTINGKIHMNSKGASAAASVVNIYKFDAATQTFSTETAGQTVASQTNYTTPAAGAAGAGTNTSGNGSTGSAGSAGGTGGGGSGGGNVGGGGTVGSGGAGAAGTAYSGGPGGGGGCYNGGGTNGSAGTANGGAGGNSGTAGASQAAGGGAGNNGGTGAGTTGNAGSNGTGGTVIIVCGGNLTIGASGGVEAKGAAGGGVTGANNFNVAGAGSGGGRVVVLYSGTLSNSGALSAAGGSGGTASGATTNYTGGAGGAGSVSGPTAIAAA